MRKRTKVRKSKRNCTDGKRNCTDGKRNCRRNKTNRKRNFRRTQTGGTNCSSTTPFVGPSWQAYGPPSNIYAPQPWYKSNNSNYYSLSKTGIDVGGAPVYYKQNGGKSRKSNKGKRRQSKKMGRKPRNSGLKRGGGFTDIVPQPILNLSRSVNNTLWDYLPTGNVWNGLSKSQSPYPYVQSKVQN